MSRRLIALLVLAALPACGQPSSNSKNSPSPSPASSQTPMYTATPRPVPSATATAAATPVSLAAFTPAAAPTATFLLVPTPAALPADRPPRIESVLLSERTVHSGDHVLERVIASSNTASVESRIGGYSLSLPKIGVGLFEVNYRVPFIPFFMHGKYQMIIIARNTKGKQSRQLIQILVQ